MFTGFYITLMAGLCPPLLTGVAALLIAFMIAGGCMSTNIGDVSYADGGFTLSVTNAGEPTEAHIQVTVYQIQDLHQTELSVLNTSVLLQKGENRVKVPGQIGPGRYKLYVYLVRNGTRQTAVIRDILV
jgi:hypothetical protein